MIEVSDLVKRYDDYLAVDHLSFHIEKGHICGFLGPNGAGKSTTMNILTGYLSPTSGSVMIGGHDVMQEPQVTKRMIGYMPEVPPLYMDMTCKEYLRFAARLKQVRKDRISDELKRVMDLAAVSHMQNRLIRNLSKGYRQRVGFACALLGDPEVIILDEPTSGFDPKQIIEMRQMIRYLGREHTVIFSSHILSEISAVCDSAVLISKGKLVANGSIDSLSRYAGSTNAYQALVQGEREQVAQAVQDLEDARNITVASAETGRSRVSLEADTAQDPRPALFYRLAQARCPILELSSHTMDLEEIFLALTGENSNKGGENNK